MIKKNKINVNNEGGRLNDIVILRSISILLVVFVHSFYIYNYGSLSDIDTIVIKIERFFNLDILNKFRMPMFIFISGFFGNALLAAGLAYLGDKLGIPIYIASVIVFGGRIFDNFGAIRRILLERFKNRRRGD